MASIYLHGYVTVRCDCGWFISATIRPIKEAVIVECESCHKKFKVGPLTIEEIA